MFDGRFRPRGSFTDPNVNVPGTPLYGNTVFQVEYVGDKLFVTFGGFAPPFGGVVDVFDADGHLLTPNHFAANAPGQGSLENPWGVALAPADFGAFSNDLLIGNVEGAGHINAFDPATGAYLGRLKRPDGTPVAIAGLWDLVFGGGSPANGRPNELFFDAGVNAVDFAGNGLFGVIHAAGDGGDDSGHDGGGRTVAIGPADTFAAAGMPVGQPAQSAAPPRPEQASVDIAPPIRLATPPKPLPAGPALLRALDPTWIDPEGGAIWDGLRRDEALDWPAVTLRHD
jgi:hypothetical protein